MNLADLQREIEQLTPEEQRKLIGFLVAMDVRRDETFRTEMARRLDDKEPQNWISLKEAKREFSGDGV